VVEQTYDVGSCVYFYFGFPFKGVNDPVAKFTEIEHAARDEILKCGGYIISLSLYIYDYLTFLFFSSFLHIIF
jgi:hypothetical protein